MLIPLSRPGYFAEIDDEYAFLAERHRWTLALDERRRYAFRNIRLPNGTKRNVFLHWCVIGHPMPGWSVDHIDGNGLNNRLSNLRFCDTAENAWNCGVRSHSTSGIKGVMWERFAKAWRGYVNARGIRYRSPYFKDIAMAAAWVKAKRAEVHGSFARDQ